MKIVIDSSRAEGGMGEVIPKWGGGFSISAGGSGRDKVEEQSEPMVGKKVWGLRSKKMVRID